MTLDRSQAPAIVGPRPVNLSPIVKHTLPGINLYLLHQPSLPVLRCELFFDAGSRYEQHNGTSLFTVKNLAEGTQKSTAAQLAQRLATLGYFVEYSQGIERASISLSGLNKYFSKTLDYLQEVLQEAVFPLQEFDNQRNIYLSQLQINEQKTSFKASVAFKEALFGIDHLLGRHVNAADTNMLNTDMLKDFYSKYIQQQPFTMFLSGKVPEHAVRDIETLLAIPNVTLPKLTKTDTLLHPTAKQIVVNMPDAVQSSLRIGGLAVNRQHADYLPLLLLNTILGGFFGSRLMKNIREDKGYTYGIHASLVPMRQQGYWLIATDVKKEYTQDTLKEIYKELERLRQNLVPETELQLAKNYIIGDFTASFNTVFEQTDKHKLAVFENLDLSYFTEFVELLKAITATQLQSIAQKYYTNTNLVEIIAGSE
jgi:zinc protease